MDEAIALDAVQGLRADRREVENLPLGSSIAWNRLSGASSGRKGVLSLGPRIEGVGMAEIAFVARGYLAAVTYAHCVN